MSLNSEVKIVRQRLNVLELAEALGNVSEACRQRGVSRTQFYEYKRRFQTHGLEGLRDLPPIHPSHPLTTPVEVEERILALEGISVSAPMIQRILNDHEMGTRFHRWLRLKQQQAGQAIELNTEEVQFIEKQNPAFRERHVESSHPGKLFCQDTF